MRILCLATNRIYINNTQQLFPLAILNIADVTFYGPGYISDKTLSNGVESFIGDIDYDFIYTDGMILFWNDSTGINPFKTSYNYFSFDNLGKQIKNMRDFFIKHNGKKILFPNIDFYHVSNNQINLLLKSKSYLITWGIEFLDYIENLNNLKDEVFADKVVKEFLNNSRDYNKIKFSLPLYKERKEVKFLDASLKLNDYKFHDNIQLGSNLKIECNFLSIGKNVKIGNSVLLKGNEIIIGDNSRIGSNVILTSSLYEGSLLVGKRCMIGSDSYLNNEKDIIIEDDVCISSDVKLITHRQWHSPFLGGESFFDKIILKNYCFIGPGTIIMPGITVGKWTTVLANSSIVNNLEERVLAGGVPAITIKQNKRLDINVDLDQTIKILLTSLSEFNFMIPNKNWHLKATENQFCFQIENKIDDIKCNLNFITSSKDIESQDDFYILYEGKLPKHIQGIEIESHHIKINDYKVERYLFDSFFNCGIHLKCY